jgi:hypothetical protein
MSFGARGNRFHGLLAFPFRSFDFEKDPKRYPNCAELNVVHRDSALFAFVTIDHSSVLNASQEHTTARAPA